MAEREIPNEPGVYVLIIESTKEKEITIGHLGLHHFPNGLYAYVGSALGKRGQNLRVRIQRHLSSEKKKRWHIDYLLCSGNVAIVAVTYSETRSRMECSVSRSMEDSGMISLVKGFGSSDCRESCQSHLHYFSNGTLEQLTSDLHEIYETLGLMPKTLSTRNQPTPNI